MTASAYIFDYGGTLDTAGRHWGQVLWRAYQTNGVPVTEQQFRDAYVYVERELGSRPIILPDYTFRKTLDIKLHMQLLRLVTTDSLDMGDIEADSLRMAMLDAIYDEVKGETARSREVLAVLKETHRLALVSNFYGNLHTVLKEFGLDNLFETVVESASVGARKPDKKIFAIALETLGLHPECAVVVGDSYKNDIAPAKQLGCQTVWLKKETWGAEALDIGNADKVIGGLVELISVAE